MKRLAVAVLTSILLPASAARAQTTAHRYNDRSFKSDQREISRFTLLFPVKAGR